MLGFLGRSEFRLSDILAALSAIFCLAYLSWPIMFPVTFWIDVQKVVVGDIDAGDEVQLRIDRVLYRGTHHGRYQVAVRDAETGVTICADGRAVGYRAGTLLAFDEERPLDWWAAGPSRDCIDWVPAPGAYLILTEHCWQYGGFGLPACRSVSSNVFTVRPRSGAAISD